MARFDVYRLKSDRILAIDLQANVLNDLPSRIMAPLYPVGDMSWSITRLNPRFLIGGEFYVMVTQRLAAIHVSEIGEGVADLSAFQDTIVAATDFLMQGF
ncbi:CcdB family protein [Pararhizobium sp. LjRoot238]|uniref:CcdB family protein n=1 Tax=Pararhizobium sp. LjRoot238 TaxID=3342293 RepID=UPI003ECE9328